MREALADRGGFGPHAQVLLILDSHESRCSVEAIKAAKRLGFQLLLLPGKTSHYLQPMDQIFVAYKARFSALRDEWLLTNPKIDRVAWIGLLDCALANMMADKPKIVAAAFSKCGMYPPSLEVAMAAAGPVVDEGGAGAVGPEVRLEPEMEAVFTTREQQQVAHVRKQAPQLKRRFIESHRLLTKPGVEEELATVVAAGKGKGGKKGADASADASAGASARAKKRKGGAKQPKAAGKRARGQ